MKKQIFRVADCKFEEVDQKLLRYSKPCKEGHQDPQGRGIRLIHSGHCLACKYKMEEGAFAHDFGDTVQPKKSLRLYSEEEGKARHIARVMQWQKDNPDKVTPVRKKYNAKAERKEANRIRSKARYEAKRQECNDKQKAYYDKNKEELCRRARAAYAKKNGWDAAEYDSEGTI